MPDVKLLVSDFDPNSAVYGQLQALDTANATALPVPAFRVGRARPVAGTLVGEGFINEITGEGSVWTSGGWVPMTPPVMARYPTDTDVLNDNAAQPGMYGLAVSTGNLYARTSANAWRMIGHRVYPQLAGLMMDTPADGTIGVELAMGSVWLRAGGRWIAQTAMHSATEAALLATNWPDGVIGMAADTGLIYARMNNAWRRVNSPTSSVGTTFPGTPAQGDIHFDQTTNMAYCYTGAQWSVVSSELIGEVKWFAGRTAPPNFLLCDGAAIPAQYPVLIALIGANTPNMMNRFARGGVPENNFPLHQWTTGRPRTAFGTNNPGDHTHNITVHGHNWDQTVNGTNIGGGYSVQGNRATAGAGGHTHQITTGGDNETAPDHVRLLPIIRAA